MNGIVRIDRSFNFFLNSLSESMFFKCLGRAFHHLGPTTEMDLSASLVRRRGTTNSGVFSQSLDLSLFALDPYLCCFFVFVNNIFNIILFSLFTFFIFIIYFRPCFNSCTLYIFVICYFIFIRVLVQ